MRPNWLELVSQAQKTGPEVINFFSCSTDHKSPTRVLAHENEGLNGV